MEAFARDAAMAETAVAAFTRTHAAFDLKGIMSSLTVLRLRSRDLNLIERQLRAKVTQFPQFFQDAPVVLDLADLEGGLPGFRWLPWSGRCRSVGSCRSRWPTSTTPTARRHGRRSGHRLAEPARPPTERRRPPPPSAGRGHCRPTRAARESHPGPPRRQPPEPRPCCARHTTPRPSRPPPPATPAPAAGPTAAPLVIRHPVRSGQLVHAEKNDLIVLAPVNPGAQLVADGNIHVYAPLRGRAVAGARGFTEARIFCQKLEAELIAISGAYVTFDDIPSERLGKPAQVHLQDGEMRLAYSSL